jgi:histidinol-phosphate aminotransferase
MGLVNLQSLNRRNLFQSTGLIATGLVTAGVGVASRPTAAAQSNDPVRLVANENPYGPSKSAQKAMSDSLGSGWMYSASEGRILREIISDREDLSQDHILITAGSGELLKMAGLSYGMTGEIVSAKPTFSMLVAYAKGAGATVKEIPLDQNMRHDLSAMEAQVTKHTSLIYICNPNNPTGTVLDADDLRSFIDGVESRATVFVDEAYVDLLDEPKHNAMVDQIRAEKNVIISRTFSKIHGMAGLRVGYAIARPDIIKRLRPLQMSFQNCMGARAAIASYQDFEFQAFSKNKIQECISVTQSTLEDLSLPYTPSVTNFVLFDTGGSVRDFTLAMREKGLLVGRSYAPYGSWCRVSMGTVEQMGRFSDALREYYKG